MFKLKAHEAVALIFVIIMISVILTYAARSASDVMDKRRAYNDKLSGKLADLAAASLVDLALLAIKDAEAGYEPTGELPDEYNEEGTTGTYTVYSRAQVNSNDMTNDFYTPIPYSGTAGPSDECDLYLNFNPEKDDLDPGHACNWNKLKYGHSVTIPLYSYDADLGVIKNPSDLGLRSWSLKVRTPCEERVYDEDCSGGDRYVMREDDDGNGTSSYDEDDSVILWQLIAENSDGDTLFNLVPDDETIYSPLTRNNIRDTSINTEIYESLINDQINIGDYVVLDTSDVSSDDSYSTLLDACNDTSIEKLYLQLDIITPLKDENDNSIPYLEWQLVTDANEAFADNKAIVVGQGLHEGQKNNFIYNYVVTRTTVGERASIYTVSN